MKIEVNNKNYNFFSDYRIILKYNSIADAFSFSAKRDVLEYFLKYPECKIFDDNNNLLITGTILAPKLRSTSKPELIRINGYGLPGILEDCNIPVSLYPLQFDNLSLIQISERILEAFGLKYVFTSNVIDDLEKKYAKVSTEPGITIKQFLNNLASQRNIFLTRNNFGELVFSRYDQSKFRPVVYFEEGNPGIENIQLYINSQLLHSEITILKEASKDNPDATEHTIQNPYVDKFRPSVKKMNSGDVFDVKKAARNALSSELSSIKINFKTTKFVNVGNTISLVAPSIKINKPTELFVEQVQISGSSKTIDKYVVTCVLPEIYSNTDFKNIFE